MRPTPKVLKEMNESVQKSIQAENKAIQAVTGLEIANMQRTNTSHPTRVAKPNGPSRRQKKLLNKAARGQANSDPKSKAFLNKYARGLSRYYASLMDPWADLDAKYPEPGAYPSTPLKISFPIQIKSNAQGRAAFILRDGIDHCFAISDDGAGTATLAYDLTPGQEGWYLTSVNWVKTPEHAALRSTFSAYRPVSLGVKVNYIAAPLNAAGKVAVALFPPSYTMPTAALITQLNWEELALFQGATTYSAIEGCQAVWKPFSTYGMADYRPTNNVFFNNGYSFDSSWDIDVQEMVAGYLSSFMVEKKVALISSGTTISGAYTNADTDEYLSSLMDYSLPSQSPAIAIMWEGLPVSTLFGELEIVINYEAITDNRTFSLSQAFGPERNQRGSSAEAEAAIASMPEVTSHSNTVNHSDWVASTAKSVSNTTAAAVSGIGKAANIALDVLDVVGTVAAFF